MYKRYCLYPPGYQVQCHLCFIEGVSLPLEARKEFLAERNLLMFHYTWLNGINWDRITMALSIWPILMCRRALSLHTCPIIDLSLPIIRSSSPSSPNNGGRESQLPQLIKVNQNFSLGRRPVSIAETNANSVRLERQRLQLENDQQLEDEIVLRERYFQYWAQQQVGNHKLF